MSNIIKFIIFIIITFLLVYNMIYINKSFSKSINHAVILHDIESWYYATFIGGSLRYKSKIYISKYDFSNINVLADKVLNSNYNKTFEENFGIIHTIDHDEILYRDSNKKCTKFFLKSKQAKCFVESVTAEINAIEIKPNYTLMYEDGVENPKKISIVLIKPRANLDEDVKDNDLTYKDFYTEKISIYKACCDIGSLNKIQNSDFPVIISQGKQSRKKELPIIDINKIRDNNLSYTKISELYKGIELYENQDKANYIKYLSLVNIYNGYHFTHYRLFQFPKTVCLYNQRCDSIKGYKDNEIFLW